jgi:Tfp pilus assembly protein PilE
MRTDRNRNNLLVEIMVAVLFFALCSGVILETFVAAREFEQRSRVETEALVRMQNVSERVYAAQNAEECLTEIGFRQKDGVWTLDGEECTFEVAVSREETEAGVIRRTVVRAIYDGEMILEIPGARYLAGGEAG